MTLQRGAPALRRLLDHHLHDLRELDVARFPAWLEPHLERWRRQPAFALREEIRDRRRAHPDLLALERERRAAREAYRASALHDAIEEARRELRGAENAVAGIRHALRSADPEEAPRLREKLDGFLARVDELRARIATLTDRSPERRALVALDRRIDSTRAGLGLDELEARLAKLHRSAGRSSGRGGRDFEAEAVDAVRELVLPELGDGGGPIELLRGVTLGAARTEIDQLLVRPAPDPEAPAEVLALVEAKRNVNDIPFGLSRRLENLAWLAGHAPGYDPEAYRTATSPTGHFAGVATHSERGRRHRFARDSFRRFLPDLEARRLPAGLYLVTRPGTLWGIGGAGLARIAHRVSTDESLDLEDPAYLAGLLEWCQGLTHEVEAPEVLRSFVAEGVGERVMLVGG